MVCDSNTSKSVGMNPGRYTVETHYCVPWGCILCLPRTASVNMQTKTEIPKEEEKDLMLFFNLNQFRNLHIWLEFKFLSQRNAEEIAERCSLPEENCRCIRHFFSHSVTSPFYFWGNRPCHQSHMTALSQRCHFSGDVPGILAFLYSNFPSSDTVEI